ncbi:hypothetical protein AAC387_Pa01g3445 [Persea americana]
MDSFLPSSSSVGSSSPPSTEALMEQVKLQLAQAHAEESLKGQMLCQVYHKAWDKLSGSESSCISRCVDRYIEAMGIISRALFSSPH